MIILLDAIIIADDEVRMTAIRSQGSGGQHVNKVSTAIHLRFDIRASSLDEVSKARLLQYKDHRISADGIVVIKAQQFRSQTMNREDALNRLRILVQAGVAVKKVRKSVRRSRSSIRKRLEKKSMRAHVKSLRKKVRDE